MYGIPPHDPALDHVSDHDLDVYIEAAFEFDNVLRGKPRVSKESLAEKVAKAQERFKKRAAQQQSQTILQTVPTTPKELGWEG